MPVEEAGEDGGALGGMGVRQAVARVREHLEAGVGEGAPERRHRLDRDERARIRVQQEDRA